jgi:type II secretory ATPase GspE/PulE/Tfp pilus assembly ATPase PilB-like protein
MAQRLVRKVCQACGRDEQLSDGQLEQLGIREESLKTRAYRRGTGCESCRQTGYRGRLAICELLVVQEQIRRRIQEQAGAAEIRDAALRGGMTLLRDDGLEKIQAGITTPEEVSRVTVRAEPVP